MLAKVIPLARTVVSGSWAATKLAGGMLSMSRDIKIGVTAAGLFVMAVSTAWVYRSHIEDSWSTPVSTPSTANALAQAPVPSAPAPVPIPPSVPAAVTTVAAATVPVAANAASPPPPGMPALPPLPTEEPEEVVQPKPPAIVPKPKPSTTAAANPPSKPAPTSDGFLAPPPMLPSAKPTATTAANDEPLAPPPKPVAPGRAAEAPKSTPRERLVKHTNRPEDNELSPVAPIEKPARPAASANAPASVKPATRAEENDLAPPPAPTKPKNSSWTPVAATTRIPPTVAAEVEDVEAEPSAPARPLVMPAPAERHTELVRSSVTDAVTNRSIPQSASLVPAAGVGAEKNTSGRPAGAKVIAESVAVARGTPVLGLPVTTKPTTDGPTPIASTRPPTEPVEQPLNDEDVRERPTTPNAVEEYVPIGRSTAAAVVNEAYVAVGANAVVGPPRPDDIRLTSAEQPIDDNKALVKSYDAETYVVLNGDTFDSIARTMYRNRELGGALARYNRSRGASNVPLRAGARVVVPPAKVLEGAASSQSEPVTVAAERTPLTAAAFPVKRNVERDEPERRPVAVASTANEPVGPTPIPSRTPVATGRPQPPGEGAVATTRVIAGQPISSSNSADQPLKIPAAQTPRGAGPSYTVTQRETLYAISRRVLGDGRRWREIYDLNTDRLESEYEVPVGITLRLPAENRR